MCARVIILFMSAGDNPRTDTQQVTGAGIEYFATFSVSAEPGSSIDFEGQLNTTGGFTPAGGGDVEFDEDLVTDQPSGTLPTEGGSFTFVPQNVAEVRQKILSSFPGVDPNLASRVLGPAATFAAPDIPSAAEVVQDVELPATIRSRIDSIDAGQTSFNTTTRVPIPQITIPTIGGEEILERIPDLQFEATWREQRGALDIVPGVGGQATATATISLPAEDYIQVREVDNCGEVFPQTESRISEAEQSIQSIQNTVSSRADRVESAVNTVLNSVPADLGTFRIDTDIDRQQLTGGATLVADGGSNILQQITVDLLVEGDIEALQGARQTLQSIPTSEPSPGFSSIRSDLNNVEGDISGIDSPSCSSEYQNRLETARGNLSDVEQIFNEYTNAIDRLTELLTEVAPDNLDCFQRFSDNSTAQRVQQIVDAPAGAVDRDELTSLIDELEDPQELEISGDCVEEFLSDLERKKDILPNLTCAEEVGQQLATEIQGIGIQLETRILPSVRDPNQRVNLEELRNLLERNRELEQRLQDVNASDECIGQFEQVLGDREERIRGIIDQVELSRREEQPAQDARETIEETVDEVVECSEAISTSTRNQVSGFETEVRNMSGVARQQTVTRLLDEGNNLIEQINQENIREECKAQFRSRVRDQLSELRSIRAIEDVDCASDFSGVASDVDEFRSNAASLVSPEPERLQELSQQAQSLIDSIRDDVDNPECQEEFINQVQSAVSRIREQTVILNISGEGATEQIEQRQQDIQELQQQVNSFLNALSGDIGDIEAPETNV